MQTNAATEELFQEPSAEYSPGYFWFLNGALTDEKITEQLEDMAKHGVKTVCPHPLPPEFRANMHSAFSPPYLSEAYFEKYRRIAAECKRLGMIGWLYDEGGWPSGRACGQVLKANPGKFPKRMLRLNDKGELEVFTAGAGPDLLSPGETEEFVRITHEAYQKHLPEYLGKTMRCTFTDEPAIYRPLPGMLPYVPEMERIFLLRKGYDIKPFLKDILLGHKDEKTLAAKIDYFDVLGQLFAERYFGVINAWCRKNNMLSSGHLNWEDEYAKALHFGNASLLRNLRMLDIPGVDLIWRQLFPGGRRHTFPKLASGIAAQKNTRRAMAEIFGVYGNGLTPEEMRYICNYLLVMGVNSFVCGCYPYTTQGAAKGGERPHFGRVNPLWQHLDSFHLTTARLCALNAAGLPSTDTALFFPTRSFWATQKEAEAMEKQLEETAWKLLGQQTDFDFVDDDVLCTAKISNGKIVIGAMAYQYLVIPAGSRLAPETEKRLAEFRSAGIAVLDGKDVAQLPSAVKITPAAPDLLVRHIHTDDGREIYFLMNHSGQELRRTIAFPGKAPVVLCDAERGKFRKTSGNEFVFAPYELLVLAQNISPGLVEEEEKRPEKDIPCTVKNIRIAPIYHITAGNVGGDYEFHFAGKDVSPQNIALGDWAGVLGKEFSGEAVYTLEIEAPEAPAVLDLGLVRYTAQLKLNGHDLGTRLYPPYSFDVKNTWEPGVNRVEIRVANTLANAIVPDAVQENWKRDGAADQEAYNLKALEFERESIPSGLFGPVRLRK